MIRAHNISTGEFQVDLDGKSKHYLGFNPPNVHKNLTM